MQPPVPFDDMTLDERIIYVQSLWDRIADEAERVPISRELAAELDNRLAEYRTDPSAVLTWTEVESDVRSGKRV